MTPVTHDCRHLLENKYGDSYSTSYGARVLIPGSQNDPIGYGLVYIPAGQSARQTCGGPLVPGPWAEAFGLAAVMDQHGGSMREIERGKAAGMVCTARIGDGLWLDDGVVVRVSLDHGDAGYPILTVVED